MVLGGELVGCREEGGGRGDGGLTFRERVRE